jgi:four helix bundle protein
MERPIFDHERLEVYQAAIEFIAWVGELLESNELRGCGLSVLKQLDSASTSIALNIAEGNGKRSQADRARFLDISRGSSFESASCLDVLVARKRASAERVAFGKSQLVRIVSMLSRLIERFAGPLG